MKATFLGFHELILYAGLTVHVSFHTKI